MNYKQVLLKKGSTYRVLWLEMAKPFKDGDHVRIKDEREFWKIERVYSKTLSKSQIRDDWQVGGITETLGRSS